MKTTTQQEQKQLQQQEQTRHTKSTTKMTPQRFFFCVTECSNETRRVLILVSKVLQNVSINFQFNEDYMKNLNPFIEEQQPLVSKIFSRLVRFTSFF